MLCHGRDPRVHGCEGEARSGNARGGLADPADGQRPGWVVGFGLDGFFTWAYVGVKPYVTCVVCSVRRMHSAGYGRAEHMCSRGEPLGLRGLFFLCAGDVMAAARVVGVRQEGVNPCRMVPSIRDEVHGSCMTSRARSSMRG